MLRPGLRILISSILAIYGVFAMSCALDVLLIGVGPSHPEYSPHIYSACRQGAGRGSARTGHLSGGQILKPCEVGGMTRIERRWP
jgi:hypothetical protein